jgi:hypothetical protein
MVIPNLKNLSYESNCADQHTGELMVARLSRGGSSISGARSKLYCQAGEARFQSFKTARTGFKVSRFQSFKTALLAFDVETLKL